MFSLINGGRARTFVALLLVLFVTVFNSSCSGRKFNLPKKELYLTDARGNTVKVTAEIASSDDERNYGFMNRKSIPDGTGMLFVFENDRTLSFWMKNTPHPLSIAYIDSTGKISDIFDMVPFSLSSVVSTRSVRFALEVPQGWFEKEGISVGSHVLFADGTALRDYSAER